MGKEIIEQTDAAIKRLEQWAAERRRVVEVIKDVSEEELGDDWLYRSWLDRAGRRARYRAALSYLRADQMMRELRGRLRQQETEKDVPTPSQGRTAE